MTDPIKVFLIDDEPVVRDGLAKILADEEDIEVVGSTGGVDAIDKAVEVEPDIIIMDLFMPEVNGLQMMPDLKEKLPNTRLMILTVSDNEGDLFSALRLGVKGYILKSTSIDRIIDSVRKVYEGETVLSDYLIKMLAADIHHKGDMPRLSPREVQVLEFLRGGLSNADIAQKLSIEESTVKTHIHHLLGKLHIKNRMEVTLFPRRNLK